MLPPAEQQLAQVLEDDAELMSNTQLAELLVTQPEEIQDEIIRINTYARPIALQVALLIPLLAGLRGLFNSFRMMRLPDPTPSDSTEGKWRASQIPDTGPNKVRPGTEDDLCENGVGSSRPSSKTRP